MRRRGWNPPPGWSFAKAREELRPDLPSPKPPPLKTLNELDELEEQPRLPLRPEKGRT